MSDPAHLPNPVRASPSTSTRIAYLLLLGVLCYAAALLARDATLEARVVGLRLWSLAGAGLFAVATPNVLLPDPNAPTLQLLNRTPFRIVRYQLRTLLPLVMVLVVPAVLLAFFDPSTPWGHLSQKGMALGQALLLISAVVLDAFVHYATIGARSQAWHEGNAGQWYGSMRETGVSFSVPRGLVPALLATARCFLLAIFVLVGSTLAMQSGWMTLSWGPGVVLLGWAGLRLARRGQVFDRHFYQTNAFYGEVLGGGTLQGAAREPIPFDSLYWVPRRWRPAVWASLRQLDRKLALGRIVALAHLGLWILVIQGAAPDAVAGYLVVLLLVQNATCGLLVTPSDAPPAFQITMQSVGDWIGARTFVNLRWIAAHAGSLALVVLFGDTYGWTWVATWTLVDVAFAVLAATVATLATEARHRRRYV